MRVRRAAWCTPAVEGARQRLRVHASASMPLCLGQRAPCYAHAAVVCACLPTAVPAAVPAMQPTPRARCSPCNKSARVRPVIHAMPQKKTWASRRRLRRRPAGGTCTATGRLTPSPLCKPGTVPGFAGNVPVRQLAFTAFCWECAGSGSWHSQQLAYGLFCCRSAEGLQMLLHMWLHRQGPTVSHMQSLLPMLLPAAPTTSRARMRCLWCSCLPVLEAASWRPLLMLRDLRPGCCLRPATWRSWAPTARWGSSAACNARLTCAACPHWPTACRRCCCAMIPAATTQAPLWHPHPPAAAPNSTLCSQRRAGWVGFRYPGTSIPCPSRPAAAGSPPVRAGAAGRRQAVVWGALLVLACGRRRVAFAVGRTVMYA